MIIINRKSTNPYFNLAAEEYLVKNMEEPCFMIWQNSPSVVIGKHQNPLKEVNLEFTQKNNIPIIRRISGGGTVYHDLGNINYSFIDFGKMESLVNFAKYSLPILQLLQKMGIDAQLDGKSDLKIKGLKFSGNASHVYKNRVLHHGTLLFNADLKILSESIRIRKNRITDRAVSSNRSLVTNISDHLDNSVNVSAFKNLLVAHIIESFPDAKIIELTSTQEKEIDKLAKEKYSSWEWNFGYSPKYMLETTVKVEEQDIVFSIFVVKGFIHETSTSSPIPQELQNALNMIIGVQHQMDIIINKLKSRFSEATVQLVKQIMSSL